MLKKILYKCRALMRFADKTHETFTVILSSHSKKKKEGIFILACKAEVIWHSKFFYVHHKNDQLSVST